MRQKDIEKLGYVLANPIRRYILQYLINPDKTPKKYSEIQKGTSAYMNKPITDGSLGWYLKDLQVNGLINKNDKKEYTVTELGEKIHNKIQMILD